MVFYLERKKGHPLCIISEKEPQSCKEVLQYYSLLLIGIDRTLSRMCASRNDQSPPNGIEYNCSSPETPLKRCDSRDPAIIIKNNSSYKISCWVTQEDKLRTSSITETVSRKMGLSVGTNGIIPTAEMKANEAQETEIKKEAVDSYILTNDERLDRGQTCRTCFPKKCEGMRVLIFFQKDKNPGWTRYKDKVYSISRGKKIFDLSATDDKIKLYLEVSLCVCVY